MNREEIIKLARKAGYGDAMAELHGPALERFAALVIANDPPQSYMRWQEGYEAGKQAEREACARVCEEFARKWWKIHCDSNLHYSSTLKAHQDFCALQAAIRARSNA